MDNADFLLQEKRSARKHRPSVLSLVGILPMIIKKERERVSQAEFSSQPTLWLLRFTGILNFIIVDILLYLYHQVFTMNIKTFKPPNIYGNAD